jgi:hypothetical protein
MLLAPWKVAMGAAARSHERPRPAAVPSAPGISGKGLGADIRYAHCLCMTTLGIIEPWDVLSRPDAVTDRGSRLGRPHLPAWNLFDAQVSALP